MYKHELVHPQRGVRGCRRLVDIIAARLANAEEVAKANVFPYQILVAYLASEGEGSVEGA
jgi:hypothetical protein